MLYLLTVWNILRIFDILLDGQHTMERKRKQKNRSSPLKGDKALKQNKSDVDYQEKEYPGFAYVPIEEKKVNLFISSEAYVKSIKDDQIQVDGKEVKLDKILNVCSLATQGGAMSPDWTPYFISTHILSELVEEVQSEKKDKSASILVHCKQGLERSVNVVLFYLMAHEGYKYSEAARTLDDALESGRGKDIVSEYMLYRDAAKYKLGSHVSKVITDFKGMQSNDMTQKMNSVIDVVKFSLSKKEKSLENIGQEKVEDSIAVKFKKPTHLLLNAKGFRSLIVAGKKIEDVIDAKYKEDYKEFKKQKNIPITSTSGASLSSSSSSAPPTSEMLKVASSKGMEQQKEEVAKQADLDERPATPPIVLNGK